MSTEWLVMRCVLTLALLAAVAWSVRDVVAKRPRAFRRIAISGIALWGQIVALAVHYFGLNLSSEGNEIYQFVQAALDGAVIPGLLVPVLSAVFPAAGETAKPWLSHGKQLLLAAFLSLVTLPACIVVSVLMLTLTHEVLFTLIWMQCLNAIPGIWLWLQASRYLETLRAQKQLDDRAVTLWAYWISAVSALGAISSALFAFIWLGS